MDVPRAESGPAQGTGRVTRGHDGNPKGMEVEMYDWNALALFGVVGLGMTTSAGLLLHTIIARLRTRERDASDRAACPC